MARTLLLTRPRAQSEAFARELEARMPGRFAAVLAPVIAIAPVAAEVDLAGIGGLVFTSANGVERFAALTPERGLPAWCVGAMTAAAARRAGFAARSAGGDVAALATLLAAEHRPESGALLHVRGRHAAGDLLGRLRAAGVAARAAEVYEQAPVPLQGEARALLADGRADVVAFFSPRSAAAFAAEAGGAGWNLAGATAVSLSAAADAGLGALRFAERRIAAEPTRAGMLAVLAAL